MSIHGYQNTPTLTMQQVRIVTVDPATGRVEGVLPEGAIVQIGVWDDPLIFRWPEEGETWRIIREGIYWVLDEIVIDPKGGKPIDQLNAGEAKIAAEVIYDRQGRRLLTDADDLGGGGGVATHVFTQSIPANPWIITHGLGRYPVGLETFDGAGIQVQGDVVHTTSTTTITFSGAMSGSATYA